MSNNSFFLVFAQSIIVSAQAWNVLCYHGNNPFFGIGVLVFVCLAWIFTLVLAIRSMK
jgi:hypothetical protein